MKTYKTRGWAQRKADELNNEIRDTDDFLYGGRYYAVKEYRSGHFEVVCVDR